jgi:hypothetical protein
MSQGQGQPAKVFISYSRRDHDALGRLQVHLKPLVRDGRIELWDDTRLRPGELWLDEIKNALSTAKVAVLLVSADFLASDFIATEELPPLLAAGRARGLVIMPVILSPCRYRETPSLAQFMSVNDPASPLSGMSRTEQEAVWVKLANAIVAALDPEESAKLPGRDPPPIIRPTVPQVGPAASRFNIGIIAGAVSVLLLVAYLTIMGGWKSGSSQTKPSRVGEAGPGGQKPGGISPKTSPLAVEKAASPAPAAAVLAGYVIDAETREPVPGVTLTVMVANTPEGRPPISVSDQTGRFRFDNLGSSADSPRQVRLVARKDGYEPSYTDPSLGATNLPIKLRPKTRAKDDPQ